MSENAHILNRGNPVTYSLEIDTNLLYVRGHFWLLKILLGEHKWLLLNGAFLPKNIISISELYTTCIFYSHFVQTPFVLILLRFPCVYCKAFASQVRLTEL